MWGEILSILEKVSEGVEVRVLFDGMNELSTLSSDYAKRLEQIGIKAKSFYRFHPLSLPITIIEITENCRY